MLLCNAEKYSSEYLAMNIKIKYREGVPQVYLFLKNKFTFQFIVYKCFHDQHLIWGGSCSMHFAEVAAQMSLPQQGPDPGPRLHLIFLLYQAIHQDGCPAWGQGITESTDHGDVK